MSTATETTVTKGFDLRCVFCGNEHDVSVRLDDVTAFHCHSCDEDFSVADVKHVMARWKTCLDWLETAPLLRHFEK